MIVPINIRWEKVSVDFSLDIDREHSSDCAVMHYAQRGLPAEPEVCQVMLRVLKPGDRVVDAGANIGFFTLLMSKLVGETGEVLAFEPGEQNLKKLYANLELNECKNVKVIEKPLWSSASLVNFYAYDDGGANSLWPEKSTDTSQQMMATTLDIECRQPALIKMDIEGGELRALRGAWATLRHEPVILTELNEVATERAGGSFEEIRKMLSAFDCFALSETGHFPTYLPRGVKVRAVRPNTNVMFATLGQVQKFWPETLI